MSARQRLLAWLNIRPQELRPVALLISGSFLVMSFVVLARAIREALYLSVFPAETLPYVMGVVAALSVPAVGRVAALLTRYPPQRVMMTLLVVLAAGLAGLWPWISAPGGAGIVAFYLWTAVGTLLVTSGFWVVSAEYFALREAKRLFGLIGAGGTAGAMVAGNSMTWLSPNVELDWLIFILLALLALCFLTQWRLPTRGVKSTREPDGPSKTSMRESLSLTWNTPHLRKIAAIVLTMALATTLLDYQFKDYAQEALATRDSLASFFGAFYGWTGGLSLLIQLLVVSRFLAFAGMAWTLAILPFVLLFGSAGVLAIPGLLMVTAVRGADASLRKSLYRSALEIVYVPVPALLRRKTKTFIDSVLDSIGEAAGAAVIFLLITMAGLGSLILSPIIIVLALILLELNRRMGQQYFATVAEQLQKSGERAEGKATTSLGRRDLLSGSFTRLDVRSLIADRAGGRVDDDDVDAENDRHAELPIRERLGSRDTRVVLQAIEQHDDWQPDDIPALARTLARDPIVDRAVKALVSAGDTAVPHLAALLRTDDTDFVIRRRIPRVLAQTGGPDADDALLDALQANRFEVRYRAAIALVRRRERDLPRSTRWNDSLIWDAIRSEIGRGRAVWELQNLLDERETDELVTRRVGVRGELSLEHTFRLLGLILDSEVVRAAFHGVILDDPHLKSFSLEYLEQVLPADVRRRLWPFIGDVSQYQRERSLRPLNDVVSDLVKTGATLFAEGEHREALKRVLEERSEGEEDERG